jgi:hypothetical protein
MNITIKTLAALTIAAAALAVTALPSSALPFFPPGAIKGIGQPAKPVAAPPAGHQIGRLPGPIKCLLCDRLPPKQPPVGPSPDGGYHDGDHDRDHGWNHWRNWRGGPQIVVEGFPETTVVAAPAQSAPVRMSAPAPVRASAPVSQQLAAEPCNCLTKQNLPDGSVLFQDICTKESAMAAPQQAVGAR